MFKRYSKKIGLSLAFLAGLGTLYYFAIARLPAEIYSQQHIIGKYHYTQTFSNFAVTEQAGNTREFTFQTFDGETVYGRITLPDIAERPYPVMVGVHAMGRSYPRWYVDAINGRPTVTNVNKITDAALAKGYAVVAIDARFHGKRKVKEKPLRSIWNDLHFFGDKSGYEAMIRDSVIDNRALIDWLETQPELDASNVLVAGYSMGGQISLLLGAVDDRVKQIVSVVPPFIDNKVAIVSPLNLVSRIDTARVLMIYGDQDDVASPEENQLVFNQIASTDKKIMSFPVDHILPEAYINVVDRWIN